MTGRSPRKPRLHPAAGPMIPAVEIGGGRRMRGRRRGHGCYDKSTRRRASTARRASSTGPTRRNSWAARTPSPRAASERDGRSGRRRVGDQPAATGRRTVPASPAPVRAETRTAPVASVRSHAAGRSILLTTSSDGPFGLRPDRRRGGVEDPQTQVGGGRRLPRHPHALRFQRIRRVPHAGRVRQLDRPAVDGQARRRPRRAWSPGVGVTMLRW